MKIDEVIRKHALKNALEYGKADPKSIIGKIIAEVPDVKKDMKSTMAKINEAVKEVNMMKKGQIDEEIKKYTFVEKKEEEKGITLPNAKEGAVVTRFPPEPSGYPHIGHAKAAFLDYEAAAQYHGNMILRFDDTNPEKSEKQYVEAIREGLKWLSVKWVKETYSSDYMEQFYEYAVKMIKKGKAYVCTCPADEIKNNRAGQKECACRKQSPKSNLEKWEGMLFKKYGKGEAILRFRGDMSAVNTVMRDPALFRILIASHYRLKDKYSVWPSYDFAAPILDSIEGITHAMRSKEYELRNELYFAVLDVLELRKPELIEFSRLSIKNAPVQKRVIRPLVEEGKVTGWDDPRLPTLAGLKRRGILPEAIRNFVMRFGLSKVESEPDWEMLLKENRKLLDPVSDRYFFVPDPVEITIENSPVTEIKIKVHPKKDSCRLVKASDDFYIPREDFKLIKEGELFRLKDLFNVRFLSKAGRKAEFIEMEGSAERRVQWVSDYSVACEILVPRDLLKDDQFNEDSLGVVEGLCESACLKLSPGDIIQFERFGFCRLDRKDKDKLFFVFSC